MLSKTTNYEKNSTLDCPVNTTGYTKTLMPDNNSPSSSSNLKNVCIQDCMNGSLMRIASSGTQQQAFCLTKPEIKYNNQNEISDVTCPYGGQYISPTNLETRLQIDPNFIEPNSHALCMSSPLEFVTTIRRT